MCDRSPHSTDNIVEETGMIRDLAPVSMRVIGPGHRRGAARPVGTERRTAVVGRLRRLECD